MVKSSVNSAWTRYPSITALRTLDAISRLGNMQSAAEMMNVTPSAVSHQLRNLESMLNMKLVRRMGRRTEMTSAGNRYLQQIRQALELIETASQPFSEEPHGDLRISCPSGFGTYWLVPELKKFSDLYPGINVEVISVPGHTESLIRNSDLSICYGDGAWPGFAVRQLSVPLTFPVCSPRLIEQIGHIRKPEDLEKFPLLHHVDTSDWVIWLAANTRKTIEVDRGTTFSDMTHVLSAAIAGNGVGISESLLAKQALEEGKLIRLFDTEVPARKSYYLVVEKERQERSITRIAIEWLTRHFE